MGVAVDKKFIYWCNGGSTTIGRAHINGTGAKQDFIKGANLPDLPAVDGSHIYWSNAGDSTLGRANLDGTGVKQAFLNVASNPGGVAVDVPSNAFTLGKPKLDTKKGTATLTAKVPGPGKLKLAGTNVAPESKTAKKAGKVKLKVKAHGAGARKLKQDGKVRLTAKVTYTPTGGTPKTVSKQLTLKLKG